MKVFLITFVGFILLGLGTIGLFIPVLPTTPFVIGAVACLGATPRIQSVILSIPIFKEYVESYRNKKAISTKTVVSSLTFLWGMMLVSIFITKKLWLAILLIAIGIAVTIHILYMARSRKDNTTNPRRLFGYFEVIFDLLYLVLAIAIGVITLLDSSSPVKIIVAATAFILVFGDSFHLIPRMSAVMTQDTIRFQIALGRGKMVTSITMTIVYILLWHIGVELFQPKFILWGTVLVYLLAGIRIALCLLPQNQWDCTEASVKWGIIRNIPFMLLGLIVGILYFINRGTIPTMQFMWVAILLSFSFYIPVFLKAHKYPALGMLMLPKSCMYLWILWICKSI
ncbi:YbaN family protein [Lachnospiraceae bacterium OttesenSCG-928-E19]|nr:YbaN family protein [Lachnospiraceae bacterium OttesenSCG-928-E19]